RSHQWHDQRIPPGRMTWTRFSARTMLSNDRQAAAAAGLGPASVAAKVPGAPAGGGGVMAEAVPAAGAPRVSRLDRRKARTRQALIDAAVRLIAEGRGDRASI